MLIPAFSATDGRCPAADLSACARLGLVSFTGDAAEAAAGIGMSLGPGPASGPVVSRVRWRPGVAGRAAIVRALARGTAMVIVESTVEVEDLVGLPIDRLAIRIGPGFAEAVEAIVRWRPYVGGFELAWSPDDDSTRAVEVRRRLRRLAGDADLVIEDPEADAGTIADLDAIGIDVLRPARIAPEVADGGLDPIDALAAVIRSPRTDGGWLAVVCDETGRALSMAAASARCVRRMVVTGRIALESDGGVVRVGASDAASPEVVAIDIDEPRSALRITVRTAPDRRPTTAPLARWTGWSMMTAADPTPLIGGTSHINPGPATLADLARRRQGVSLAG